MTPERTFLVGAIFAAMCVIALWALGTDAPQCQSLRSYGACQSAMNP